MNPDTVISDYAQAITEEKKNYVMEKPTRSVYSGSQLTSFFGHIMLLNLDLTN